MDAISKKPRFICISNLAFNIFDLKLVRKYSTEKHPYQIIIIFKDGAMELLNYETEGSRDAVLQYILSGLEKFNSEV